MICIFQFYLYNKYLNIIFISVPTSPSIVLFFTFFIVLTTNSVCESYTLLLRVVGLYNVFVLGIATTGNVKLNIYTAPESALFASSFVFAPIITFPWSIDTYSPNLSLFPGSAATNFVPVPQSPSAALSNMYADPELFIVSSL